MKKDKKDKTFQLRISDTDRQKLEKLAQKRKISKSELIRKLIDEKSG